MTAGLSRTVEKKEKGTRRKTCIAEINNLVRNRNCYTEAGRVDPPESDISPPPPDRYRPRT